MVELLLEILFGSPKEGMVYAIEPLTMALIAGGLKLAGGAPNFFKSKQERALEGVMGRQQDRMDELQPILENRPEMGAEVSAFRTTNGR